MYFLKDFLNIFLNSFSISISFFPFNFRSIQFRNCRRWPRPFITKSWISTQEHPFGAKFAQTTNRWIKAYHIATQISSYRTRCWVVEWGKYNFIYFLNNSSRIRKLYPSCMPTKKACTMVFCYQNCSDLLWEKNVLVIDFWNSRLKAENLQKCWDHYRTIYSNSALWADSLHKGVRKVEPWMLNYW